MSERINEIATQAENYAHEQNDKFGLSYKREYDKKFAELIVRECLETIETSTTLQLPKRDIDKIYTIVKQHFGVEE